jgi:hypothetical protein
MRPMRMAPKMVGQPVRVLSMALRVTATSRYISSIALVTRIELPILRYSLVAFV